MTLYDIKPYTIVFEFGAVLPPAVVVQAMLSAVPKASPVKSKVNVFLDVAGTKNWQSGIVLPTVGAALFHIPKYVAAEFALLSTQIW